MPAKLADSQYDTIKKEFGAFASWAVWRERCGGKPKDFVGDMTCFDEDKRNELLPKLKPGIIMAALNFSCEVFDELPFRNFHDPRPHAQDYKIRHAFENTNYYGAYMTDVIKNLQNKNSGEVLRFVRNNTGVLEENMKIFRNEIAALANGNPPVIICFGIAAHTILSKTLGQTEYCRLVKVPHYSHHINADGYRREVLRILGD